MINEFAYCVFKKWVLSGKKVLISVLDYAQALLSIKPSCIKPTIPSLKLHANTIPYLNFLL